MKKNLFFGVNVGIKNKEHFCGILMKNNAPVGGAIALDFCKVPTFSQGPPLGKPMTGAKRQNNIRELEIRTCSTLCFFLVFPSFCS